MAIKREHMHSIIDQLNRENLCSYFILPLLKLNKFKFLKSNFVDSYLSHDLSMIVVEVIDTSLLSRQVLESHTHYIGMEKDDEGHAFLMYQFPSRWYMDLILFTKGKYSQMSDNAKEIILRDSGLDNNRKTIIKGVVAYITDPQLFALERHPILKEMWEKELGVFLSDDSELLSKPGERSYIDLSKLKRKG